MDRARGVPLTDSQPQWASSFGKSLLTHWSRDKWPPFSRRHFKCIFLNENIWISSLISPKFVPEGPINNIPALVQIMAWRRPGDKPLSEPMMVSLPMHICVTRPQWVYYTGRQVLERDSNWNGVQNTNLHLAYLRNSAEITWTPDILP